MKVSLKVIKATAVRLQPTKCSIKYVEAIVIYVNT